MKKILLMATLSSTIFTGSLVATEFIKGEYYGGAGLGVENFSSTPIAK